MDKTKRWIRGLLPHVTAVAIAALVAWLAWKEPVQGGSMGRFFRNIASTRVTAYASLALLCLTLSFGPLARLWPRGFGWIVATRRATGIWSAVAAGTHLWFALQGYGAGNLWNMLFYGGRRMYAAFGAPTDGPLAAKWLPNLMTPTGVAYWLGVSALAILAALAFISNDRAQRWLGSTWKFIQQQSYLAFALVFAHFAIVYFNPFKGSLPKEKIAFYAFATVAALQAAGFARTVWQRRVQQATAAGLRQSRGAGT